MMDSSFTTPLKVEHLDGVVWKVLEAFTYHNKTVLVTVSKGFITDFASIPRLFWSVIGHPTGKYGKAAVIHDYLYHVQEVSRSKADRIFLQAMKDLKVSWWRRRTMWLAVRMFAGLVWRKHRKELEKIQ